MKIMTETEKKTTKKTENGQQENPKPGRKTHRCGKVITGCIAAALLLYAGWMALKISAVRFSDTLYRYSFTGLENMFHNRYEYYVTVKGVPVKVSKWMLEGRYPGYLDEDSKYDDDGISYYFVQLVYNEQGKPQYDHQKKIELSHGREYFLIYDLWTHASKEVTDREIAYFQEITEQLHDFDLSPDLENCKWYSGDGQHRGLLSFMMITDGEKIVAYTDDTVYSYRDGKVCKIMKQPEKGGLDYCRFAK